MRTPPRRRSTRLLATAASSLALILAGCGSDDEGRPIPAQAVQGLQKQLDSISSRFEVGGGACNDIGTGDDNNVDAVQRILDGLRSVDADVRRALARSFDRLFQLTSEQCDETKGQRTTPQTTPQPPPAVTVPQPTQTETQPQKREQPQQRQKPDKGKGQGQGKEKGGNEQGPPAGQDGGAEAPQ